MLVMSPRLAFLSLVPFLLPTTALAEPHCDISQFTPATSTLQKGVVSGDLAVAAWIDA